MLDAVEKSGYIASSYEISTDYQEVNLPPFYFKVGNDVYLLNELDNLAMRQFQTMAVPGDKTGKRPTSKSQVRNQVTFALPLST